MLSRQYTYVFGAVSPLDGQFDTLILPRADTSCMQLFLDEVALVACMRKLLTIINAILKSRVAWSVTYPQGETVKIA